MPAAKTAPMVLGVIHRRVGERGTAKREGRVVVAPAIRFAYGIVEIIKIAGSVYLIRSALGRHLDLGARGVVEIRSLVTN